MNNFNDRCQQLMEDVTTGAFGGNQAHMAPAGQSGDFYAPGDARNIWGNGKPTPHKKNHLKAKKFKAPTNVKEAYPMIRRNFPASM